MGDLTADCRDRSVNRTLPKRLAALLVAVLFLLSGAGDAFGAHPCPHHDPSLSTGDAHAGHAPAAGASTHAHGADHPAPADGHGPCTCQGACQASTGAAPPDAATLRLEAAVAGAAPAPFRGGGLLLPSLPAFFLPYAHAPPQRG